MAEDEEARYAQALRFLTSLQSQNHQDIDSQRSFLQSKGLSEELIARAFQDAKRPDSIAADVTASTNTDGVQSENDDSEAFERAAKMFDEPVSSSSSSLQQPLPPTTPPKTHPKSPLALYQSPQSLLQQQQAYQDSNTPITTRYDVLLGFFRSMCYFLVLGGGVTGVLVALYRSYLLPRMISTLDSRSVLLKHHLEQYSLLTNKIKGLRGNSIAPSSQRKVEAASAAAPRKGVLKKVQFADEIATEKRIVEEEDKKEAGESTESRTEVTNDEVEDEKKANVEEREEGGEGEEKSNVMEPIDVLGPMRNSLARLSQALKADMSASAIGTEVTAPSSVGSSEHSSNKSSTRATTVEEESSDADSWVSEEDSDELEFDPYSPTSTSSSKRKHDPGNVSKSSKDSGGLTNASTTTAVSLNSSLSTLNAYINSQTYLASSHAFGGRMLGMGGIGSASSNTEKEGSKAGDVAQIRADIRNLKGLLLSRRNFPIYRTSPAVTSTPNNPV